MKKVFKRFMGRTAAQAVICATMQVAVVCMVLSSCTKGNEDRDNPGGADGTGSSGPLTVNVSGVISHTNHTPRQRATVTFSRFPANTAEFTKVQEQIGGEPHGAVVLQLMAYEMYRRNRTTGEACIRLNNATINVRISLDRLQELFSNDTYYARPYQIAAFLKGATPENGYSPTKPYTVEIEVSNAIAYEYSSDYQANVLTLRVLTQGKDKGAEEVAVLKTAKPGEPGNGACFIVFNCPGLYSQVKQISFTSPFGGLD